MYEDCNTDDLKKAEEEEDSETWSYSYPSYSRFIFTGKTKSRLGRNNNRHLRPSMNKEETRATKNSESNPEPVNSVFNQGSSSQPPKTPCWLRGDKLGVSNPFTPGTNGFKYSEGLHDSQAIVNDSGIDVSSQSNFFFTLKTDPNQTCKRNLAFNHTPFKSQGNHENTLKELNQCLEKSSFPRLSFSSGIKEENKENSDCAKNVYSVKCNEATSFDPSWNRLENKFDAAVPPQIAVSSKTPEMSRALNVGDKNHLCTIADQPVGQNVFAPIKVFDKTSNQKKAEEDSAGAPLDLSSGESLSNKNIFSRHVSRESDKIIETVEISAARDTLANSLGQPKDMTKESIDKDCDVIKQRSSSDCFSSILPKFLVPTNKSKSNQSNTDSDISTELPATVVIDMKNPTNLDNHTPLIPNSLKKPFSLQPSKITENSMYATEVSQNIGLAKSNVSEMLVTDKNLQQSSHDRPTHHNNVFKEAQQYVSVKNLPSVYKHPYYSSTLSSKTINDSQMGLVNETQFPVNHLKQINMDNMSKMEHEEDKIQSVEEVSKPSSNPQKYCSDRISQPNVTLTESSGDQINAGYEDLISKQSNKNNINDQPRQLESCSQVQAVDSKSIAHLSTNSLNNNLNSNHVDAKHLEHHLPYHPRSHNPFSHLEKNYKPYKQLPQSQIPWGVSQWPVEKEIGSSKSCVKQMSAQQRSTSPSKLNVDNQDPSSFIKEENQQKTFLAPHPPDRRISSNAASSGFPHVKPEIPQQISSKPSLPVIKRPPNNFKISAPRGLLTHANSELYVNSKTYTILSMLGRGGSSEVYQVLDPRSSKLLAIKCVDLSMVDRTIADGYLNEIDLLSKLQGCSSVIRMFDYEYVQEYKMLHVVMEKGDTDLSQLIRDISKTKKISMSMIIYYWTEMLTAVRDIHEQGIIHSDLKPANFLLVSGRLKLIDFGIASSQGDMTSVVKEVTTGTWNYMSPEAIRNTSSSGKGFKITYKSDVWSLGCILYNLVYGKTPFSHITNTWGKLQAIADPTHQIEFPEVGAPVVLAQALQSCFHRDPKQRPTVAELLSLQYHATCDTTYIGHQLLDILPHQWWLKVSHLFPDIKVSEEVKNSDDNTV